MSEESSLYEMDIFERMEWLKEVLKKEELTEEELNFIKEELDFPEFYS